MKRSREDNINTAAYWDNIYITEHSHCRQRVDERRLQELLRWLLVREEEVQRSPALLDVGCGLGDVSHFVSKHLPGSLVTGIDISHASIEFCSRHPTSREGQYQRADAQRLPFEDETFDVVWCGETLEHVEEPDRVIVEMRRVTQEHGFIVLSTPYRRRNTSEEHVWEYDPMDISRWASMCGELVFLDCLLLPSWLTMFSVFRKVQHREPS